MHSPYPQTLINLCEDFSSGVDNRYALHDWFMEHGMPSIAICHFGPDRCIPGHKMCSVVTVVLLSIPYPLYKTLPVQEEECTHRLAVDAARDARERAV